MACVSSTEALKEHLEQNPENKTCLSWEIKRSDLGGRGLFANKPIKKGSLIFLNKPLVIGPRADRSRETFCIACFEISSSCVQCEKCYLTICSKHCKFAPRHVNKCDFISNNWKLKPSLMNDLQLLPEMLIYLECLLLTDHQKRLLSLLQKSNSKRCQGNVTELSTLISNDVIPEHQIKFIEICSSILQINSFRIPNDNQTKKTLLRALYPLSAFLNHSCIPNTRNQFRDNFSMAVYASRDIDTEEEILSCYTGLLWCTSARRMQLYKTKNFWCQCERCSDSSEMGTRLSALRCLNKECVGVILPVTPLDPECEWRCDTCGAAEPAGRVGAVQAVLGGLLRSLHPEDPLQLETFVQERLAAFLPYSNHVYVDLRLRLALKLGFVEDFKLIGIKACMLNLYSIRCPYTY